MAGIELKKVTKRFGSVEVIPGVDLSIKEGEFLVFVGPSGCGKSTLLRLMAGLETLSDGEIWIGGKQVNNVGPADRGAAMVFQSYALYPHMTVEDNMGFGLRMSGMAKPEIRSRVHAAADKLKLTPLLNRFPKQLSGGQRQRVAIGRAIVRRPEVFLFDEPLSNLDAALRVQMRIELAQLHADLGTTMVYVTHDQTEAMTLGDRIAVFNQGRIEQLGAPMALYKQPDNLFVAEFLGSPKINILPCRMADGVVTVGSGVELPLNLLGLTLETLGSGTRLGVRPENWRVLATGEVGLWGQIEFIENLGDNAIVYLRVAGLETPVNIKLSADQFDAALGDTMGVAPIAGHVLVFDVNGQRVRSEKKASQ
jgi:multiple sugar transport system ATP-binding protein